MQFVLATTNEHKVREISQILAAVGLELELVPRPAHLPDVEESGTTFEENARLKAVAVCAATGLPSIADDSGLVVDALGGAPGVRSARYAGTHEPDDGDGRTFAQMPAAAKHEISHRGRAFRTLADGLRIMDATGG